jgi:hypothetical protein
MKTFHCQYCGNPVFFENVRCLQCGSVLAFLPDRMAIAAVEPVPQKKNFWRRRLRARRTVSRQHYRMCANSTQYQACNFGVPADDPNPLCVSCRQTRVLPDLSIAANRDRWLRIEAAKRRLFYTLARLGLASPTLPGGERDGPVYEFLADLPGQRVMTGHLHGVITLNVAEADDAERTRLRVAMHEPYRTLLGHLRHESGHYYWDHLIRDGGQLEAFRAVFGDERVDYAQALQAYYARGGAIAQWQDRHVSAYASAHPWEDWAETWAHYLHMVDLMENCRVVQHAPEHARQRRRSGRGDQPAGNGRARLRRAGGTVGAGDAAGEQPEPRAGPGGRVSVRLVCRRAREAALRAPGDPAHPGGRARGGTRARAAGTTATRLKPRWPPRGKGRASGLCHERASVSRP